MRTILIASLLFILSICRTPTCQAQLNPCEHLLNPVLTLSAGPPYNLYAEGGVMGLGDRVGLYGGLKFFNQTPAPPKHNELPSQSSLVTEPYARLSYRISNAEASVFRQYLTGWYGLNGIRGVSYRLGLILDPSIMLALEPNYSRENGAGVNVTLMARLD